VPVARRLLDRLLYVIAWFASEGFFRDIEIAGREHVPPPGTPCLVVANHFNGFVDPVLVVRGLGRVPRFLAKATLWNVWPARPLFALTGIVPVHRRDDAGRGGAPARGNQVAFLRAHDALGAGQTVAIFPEGTTHDEPRLADMRTGAARIALGAAMTTRGIHILPVGVVVEDKLETRSRALVQVGAPLDLDQALEVEALTPDPEDHAAVRRLTAHLTDQLRAITPDFETGRDHGALTLAAELVARTPGAHASGEVELARREQLAKTLGSLPPHHRAEVRAAVADYQLDLALLGVRDSELVAGLDVRQVAVRLLRTAALLLVLAPLALVGILVNVAPGVLVVFAGQWAEAPVSKGTTRVLTALATFPATWWLVAAMVADGWLRVVATMLALATCGLVAAVWADIAANSLRDLRAWRSVRNRRALLGPVRAHRARLVELVERLSGSAPGA
jgi:glycerol-3-phosphate O-acyltransferase / dihydroxyacetone phosphate acyltransferase